MGHIYLDCDGVLADFDRSAEVILGMPPGDFERLHGDHLFWKKLAAAPDFFGDLAPMPDAMALYDAVRHRRPTILTGMPRGGWAEAQKRRWGARHFPGVPMITTLAALKSEHCRPGDVLVDDRNKYRGLWEDAGGLFVHHRNAEQSIAELRELGLI